MGERRWHARGVRRLIVCLAVFAAMILAGVGLPAVAGAITMGLRLRGYVCKETALPFGVLTTAQTRSTRNDNTIIPTSASVVRSQSR